MQRYSYNVRTCNLWKDEPPVVAKGEGAPSGMMILVHGTELYLPIKHYWTSYIFALSLFSAASQVWKTIEAKFMATVWRSVAGILTRASS
jgi:hypothetical protein